MTSPAPDAYGFVGLGNMGGPMAANLKAAGFDVIAYDAAGTADRAPAGATIAQGPADVAAAETVFFSLPDGPISAEVAAAIAVTPGRRATTVIDLSTIGPGHATDIAARLAEAGMAYMDAPVSGGTAGAKAGTVTVMFAGPENVLARHRPALDAMGRVFHVGTRPGQGQAMKLLNNFLSATAMAATSEAVHFGLSQGLDLTTMIDVLNVSTGRNSATDDKFPKRILTGTFDAGFTARLMTKDLALYRQAATAAGGENRVLATVDALWRELLAAWPDCDFTEVYRYVGGQGPVERDGG